MQEFKNKSDPKPKGRFRQWRDDGGDVVLSYLRVAIVILIVSGIFWVSPDIKTAVRWLTVAAFIVVSRRLTRK
jgi:hypothetical protein